MDFTTIFPFCFAETLEMDDFPGAQEADGLRHIGIPYGSEDVVIRGSGLLFRSHVFRQIRDDIALRLELTGIEGNPARCLGPERRGVVDVVRAEAGIFNFLHGKILGELIDDGADHFEVGKFVGT